MFKSALYFTKIISLLLIVCSMATGCENYFDSETPQNTIINTKPATSLALSLADFPIGWQLIDSNDKSNACYREFSNSVITIKCSVHVYSNIDEAQTQYDFDYSDYSKRFSISNPSVGNQSYAFQTTYPQDSSTTYHIYFIKNNVTVGLFETAAVNTITLNEAVSWVRKIEIKIP